MQKGQAAGKRGTGNIGPLEAYHILLERQMNEDRRIVEISTIFLLASSFLFLAFVGLLHPSLAPIFKWLRIILPIVGIFLTFFLYHLNLSAANALRFWHRAEQKIEETASEFAYMRGNEITPHMHGYETIRGEKKLEKTKEGKWKLVDVEKPWSWYNKPLHYAWLRHLFELYLPASLLALWIASLVVAIIK